MKIKYSLFLYLLLLSMTADAKLRSLDITSQAKNIQINQYYSEVSKAGRLSITDCTYCNKRGYIITENTRFVVDGELRAITDLTEIKLKNVASTVRLQIRKKNNEILRIHWTNNKIVELRDLY